MQIAHKVKEKILGWLSPDDYLPDLEPVDFELDKKSLAEVEKLLDKDVKNTEDR